MRQATVVDISEDGTPVLQVWDVPDDWEPPATWHQIASGMASPFDRARTLAAAAELGAHMEVEGEVVF